MHQFSFSDNQNIFPFFFFFNPAPSQKGLFIGLANPVLNCRCSPPYVVHIAIQSFTSTAQLLRLVLFCGSCLSFPNNKYSGSSLRSRWMEPSDRNVKRGVDASGSLGFPSTAAGHRHILEFATCQTDIHSRLVCRRNKKGKHAKSLLNGGSLLDPIFLLFPKSCR